jgi:hypothetical protein
MHKWKRVAKGVASIAFGFGMFYFAWDMWNQFAQLESGQRDSLKIWAPMAAIYNLGGVWTAIGKWGFLAFLGFSGLSMIFLLGIPELFPGAAWPRVASPEQSPVVAPRQLDPYPSSHYDASFDLDVTPAQIANQETIVIRGPNGDFPVKLQKFFRSGRLPFPGEGRERRGTLYVVLKVRDH